MQQCRFQAFTGGGVGRYKMLASAEIEELWSRWQRGETPVQISAQLGCHQWTIGWHVDRSGGLRPRTRQRAARHLTPAEREEISRAVVAKESVQQIARRPTDRRRRSVASWRGTGGGSTIGRARPTPPRGSEGGSQSSVAWWSRPNSARSLSRSCKRLVAAADCRVVTHPVSR